MVSNRSVITSAFIVAVGILLGAPPRVHAERIVTVLFTGFNPGPAGMTGMDDLNTVLQAQFGGNPTRPFSSMVIRDQNIQAANNFINMFNDINCLVLIGHSFGGNAVISLARDVLLPNNRIVDLTIQIDSVQSTPPLGPNLGTDAAIPANVEQGINYFQIATLIPPDIQGRMNVMGAENINVEQLFNDNTITHSSIDNDVRLHQRIVGDIRLACIPEPSTLTLLGIGTVGLIAYHRGRRRQATSRR